MDEGCSSSGIKPKERNAGDKGLYGVDISSNHMLSKTIRKTLLPHTYPRQPVNDTR